MTVRDLAALIEATVIGPKDTRLSGVAKVEEAGEGSVTFIGHPKYEKYLAETHATAVIVSPAFDVSRHARAGRSFLVVPEPYAAFVKCVQQFVPPVDPFVPGVHPTAVVSAGAQVGKDVWIGAHSVIGEGAALGDQTKVGNNVSLGKGSSLGAMCRIHDGVTIYHGCVLGARVVVHSGAVIGSDGFGFITRPDGSYEKIPQLGIVRVGDDCEIGANTTIDRATLGETRLGNGVKLDNLVHIAHNVVIDDHAAIAGQTGISGSSKIGKYARLAGQVGIGGHVEIADRTTILGQSGVTKSIAEPGHTWFGTPAKERVKAGRLEALIRLLPEMKAELDALKDASSKKQ